MADKNYKKLAEAAMERAEQGGPSSDFYFAQAQSYWAAHNAETLDVLIGAVGKLTSEMDGLNFSIQELSSRMGNQ